MGMGIGARATARTVAVTVAAEAVVAATEQAAAVLWVSNYVYRELIIPCSTFYKIDV